MKLCFISTAFTQFGARGLNRLTFQLRQCLQFGGIFGPIMRWALGSFLFFRLNCSFASERIYTIYHPCRHGLSYVEENNPGKVNVLPFTRTSWLLHMHICQIRGNTKPVSFCKITNYTPPKLCSYPLLTRLVLEWYTSIIHTTII